MHAVRVLEPALRVQVRIRHREDRSAFRRASRGEGRAKLILWPPVLALQPLVDQPLGQRIAVPRPAFPEAPREPILVCGGASPLEVLRQLQQPIPRGAQVYCFPSRSIRWKVIMKVSQLVGILPLLLRDVDQRGVHEPVAEALAAERARVVDPDPGSPTK